MNEIEDFLEHMEIGFVRIDGTSTQPIRTAAVAKFQEDDKVQYHPTFAWLRVKRSLSVCLTNYSLWLLPLPLFVCLFFSSFVAHWYPYSVHRPTLPC